MDQSTSLVTTTELQTVPILLRRITEGEIQVPIFQRDFIWSNQQILQLFQSIYKGFPIGSIILWRTNDRNVRAKLGKNISFPNTKIRYPTTFIVDGFQRLSTLYGALIDQKNTNIKYKFDIAFDLKNERFKNIHGSTLKSHFFRLSYLFYHEPFVNAQKSLFQHKDAELLIKHLMLLYNIFQQYLIPLVKIENCTFQEVVEIFEKLNTQGKRLSRSDLRRARLLRSNKK